MKFEYAVKLTPAQKFAKNETGFIVTCRDLPEVITEGEDRADALHQARDAMDAAFYSRIKHNEDFPLPSAAKRGEVLVSPPAEMVAKAALYVALKQSGVTRYQLAKRLQVDETEVRRLLDPRHGSKLPRLAEAVQALGARLVIELERAA